MKKVYSEYDSFQWEKKHTRFLVLNKDEINRACFSPEIVGYDVIQIEPGFNDDYMVEVVEKGSGITMVPISDSDNIVKNMCGDKGDVIS